MFPEFVSPGLTSFAVIFVCLLFGLYVLASMTLPECFREMYPSTRVIIECTEFFLEMPSCRRSQSVTFSNYKHHNTAKGIIGLAPSGAVAFVYDLCAGRCSDKQITIAYGIIDRLEEGETIEHRSVTSRKF